MMTVKILPYSNLFSLFGFNISNIIDNEHIRLKKLFDVLKKCSLSIFSGGYKTDHKSSSNDHIEH